MAIKYGDLRIVDFLVQNSGATDKKTKSGSTPLHYCALYGRTEPAKLLLRAGVDLQIQDNEKQTALDVAKQRRNKPIEDLVCSSRISAKLELDFPNFQIYYLTIFIR